MQRRARARLTRRATPQAVEEFAGVDTLGLLTGSLAMTSFANRVRALDGSAPAGLLDSYYQLAQANSHKPGLDAQGLPAVKAGGTIPALSQGGYHLSRADLERCSVVVPDLSLLQVGDLIVRYGAGERLAARQRSGFDNDAAAQDLEPTQVGIVVKIEGAKPAFGHLDRSFLSRVYVVSIREGFEQVTLGTWGNPGVNIFGGFAYEPERYHVRRLLVDNRQADPAPEAPAGAPVAVAQRWDVFAGTIAGGSLSLHNYRDHSASGIAENERWIPNTGQYLEIGELIVDVRNEFDLDALNCRQ